MTNELHHLEKKQKLYYARIMPTIGIYEVCDLTAQVVKDTYFVGTDKHDKHAYLFSYKDIGVTVFFDRKEALDKVLFAERTNKIKDNEEGD